MSSVGRPAAPVPRVGISRCLLGDEVRYDGGHKRDPILLERLGRHVEWVSVCPEVEVGMGTPREPIQLVAAPDGTASGARRVRLFGVRSRRDWTEDMVAFARGRIRELASLGVAGYVFKKDSPSCGMQDVPVYDIEGRRRHRGGRGLFAQALMEAMPDLPVEDEERLHDPAVQQDFLARVMRYHRARYGP